MKEKTASLTFGLVGSGLSHSFSPSYFARKFKALGLPHQYVLFDLPSIEAFHTTVAALPHLGGLNVTIPYKTAIIPYLQALTPEAQAIGAVNTIAILPNGHLLGHNTDWVGFRQALAEDFRPAAPYRALVLGTGGASKAVDYALQQDPLCNGIDHASRNAGPCLLAYEAISADQLATYGLVVNTTPLGMHPRTDVAPTLPWKGCHPAQHYYDLIYNPARTLFMQRARMAGASVQNGLRMLELQAEAAWAFWQQHTI
jgi:shikimate dehydrogenase